MTTRFGLGIENETVFQFSDKVRKKRQYDVLSGQVRGNWNGSRWGSGSGMFYRSRDGTVLGGGHEFQTTGRYALNVKPKRMVEELSKAINKAALQLSGGRDLDLKKPNSFGIPVGFQNRGGFTGYGSFHINLTMPHDTSITTRSDPRYTTYINKLFKGIKVLRAIEPLFIAMIGGAEIRSVGKPGIAEGSGRQAYDHYGNLGRVSLNDEFKRILINSSGYHFKGGNSQPSYRRLLSQTIGREQNVAETGVGDVVVKRGGNYDNVRPFPVVEFRFLDPFYVPNLYDVLKVMISALEHGSNVGDIQDGKSSSAWNEASARIIEEGWDTRIPKKYISFLKTKLGIAIKSKDGVRADILFDEVAKLLWEKNKRGKWVTAMFDEFSVPKVVPLNRYNWDMQFRHKYLNDSSFRDYIKKLVTILAKIDASRSGGWVNISYKGNKKGLRDVLLDDQRFGVDMATEDHEDIMFLLERTGKVELKLKNGHPIAVKSLTQNPKEILKGIAEMEEIDDIDTFFGQQTGETIEEPEEPQPEGEPSMTPSAPRVGRRVPLRTSETTNITMSDLRITRIYPAQDDPLDYNVRFMRDIFRQANYVDENGRAYQIEIIPATIRYRSTELKSFWIKNGSSVNIYLSNAFNRDDPLSELVDLLKRNFFSPVSVTRPNIFTRQLTIDQFFDRLRTVALEVYDKGTSIKLDRAGIEGLKSEGIRIASLSRGKRYFLVDKARFKKMKNKNVKLINYIPYQKKFRVQKIDGKYNLMMNGKIIDSIGGKK